MLGKEKFRGAYNFHDILDAAGSSEVKAITDLQNTLQFDDPVNIQFTSVFIVSIKHFIVLLAFNY